MDGKLKKYKVAILTLAMGCKDCNDIDNIGDQIEQFNNYTTQIHKSKTKEELEAGLNAKLIDEVRSTGISQRAAELFIDGLKAILNSEQSENKENNNKETNKSNKLTN